MLNAGFHGEPIVLDPPWYGWQKRGRSTPAGLPVAGRLTHKMLVLSVQGSSVAPHRKLHVRTRLTARGAVLHEATRHLCTALDADPMFETRTPCNASASGDFRATVWVPDLGTHPREWLADEPALRGGPASLVAYAERPCAWVQALLSGGWTGGFASLIGRECARDAAATLSDIFGRPRWSMAAMNAQLFANATSQLQRKAGVGYSQIFGDALKAVAIAFMQAVATLPQPFAIIESGNLCGASTTLLALLRKRFCPRCPFVSTDPGWARVTFARPGVFECAANTLRWANLSSEVRLIDDVSIALPADGVPIGFVYLDDGKSRFYNEPFLAMIEARLMVGGVVAFDDPCAAKPTPTLTHPPPSHRLSRLPPPRALRWQEERLPHSRYHYGQATFATELVSTGDYAPLIMTPKGAFHKLGRTWGRPSARLLTEWEAMTERAPFRDLLRSTLTIAVHRVASRYDAAGGVQVTLEDRRGLALGATWAALP